MIKHIFACKAIVYFLNFAFWCQKLFSTLLRKNSCHKFRGKYLVFESNAKIPHIHAKSLTAVINKGAMGTFRCLLAPLSQHMVNRRSLFFLLSSLHFWCPYLLHKAFYWILFPSIAISNHPENAVWSMSRNQTVLIFTVLLQQFTVINNVEGKVIDGCII